LKTLTTAGIEKLLAEEDDSQTSSKLVIAAVPPRIGVSRSASNLLSSARKDSNGVTSAGADTSQFIPSLRSVKNLNVSDCESALGSGLCDTSSLLSVPGSMVIKQEPGLPAPSLETVINNSNFGSLDGGVKIGGGVEKKGNMPDRKSLGMRDKKMTGAINKNIGVSVKTEGGVDKKVVGKTKQKAVVCPRYQSKNNAKDNVPIKRTAIKQEVMENVNKSKQTNSRMNMQIKNGKFETKVKPVLRQSGSTSRLARKGSQSSRRIPKTVQSRRTPQSRVVVKKPQNKEESLKTIKKEREETEEVSIEYEETEETQCPYCMKQFANWNYLSKHMTKVHVNEV